MRNLLEFLSKSGHWLLFVFLEVISLVLLFQYNSYQGSVWITSANAVTGRIYEWESAVEAFFSLTRINEGLTMRNFYLERQVDQLSRLYTEATDDTTAAERYGLKLLEQYELIPAKVVSNSLHREDNLITINRGRADGVRTDMGVACGLGVVGVVYMVSEHYSIVMPVLNVNSRVSCTIRKRGISSICVGAVAILQWLMWRIFPVMHISSVATGSRPTAIRRYSHRACRQARLSRYITRATDCRTV